ncbi:MAG: hypothetical protein JW783_09155 [Bacteroidales bacterium]|nr:hypothetical protein [Bacteroidales bacterium]MBN2749733.1 hypothetical protein [Bacteroidales bacterium]
MELEHHNSVDTGNEFLDYRERCRFEPSQLVEVRTGKDLEAARFMVRHLFPSVVKEYWWVKPSDVASFRNTPLKVSSIYYYKDGIPVILLNTADGSITRKTQIFLKYPEESVGLEPDRKLAIHNLDFASQCKLLLSNNLYERVEVAKIFSEQEPPLLPTDKLQQINLFVLLQNYNALVELGEDSIPPLLERFFVSSGQKETESIAETFMRIGAPCIPFIDEAQKSLSEMASPYYAKRLRWVLSKFQKK